MVVINMAKLNVLKTWIVLILITVKISQSLTEINESNYFNNEFHMCHMFCNYLYNRLLIMESLNFIKVLDVDERWLFE